MYMPCWLLAMISHNSVLLPKEIAVLTLVPANEALDLSLTIMNPHILSVVSYRFLYKFQASAYPRNIK
jgi:hypothetical protein